MYRLCYSFRVHISWSAPRAAERAAKHRSNSAKTRTCRVCFSNKPASGCSALQASSSSPSDGRPLPDARDAAAAAAATPPRCTARCGREQISRRQALVLLRTCAVCRSGVSTRSGAVLTLRSMWKHAAPLSAISERNRARSRGGGEGGGGRRRRSTRPDLCTRAAGSSSTHASSRWACATSSYHDQLPHLTDGGDDRVQPPLRRLMLAG